MNKDKILEIVEQTKRGDISLEVRELAESFESFIELYHSKDQLFKDPGFLPALQAAHRRLHEKFDLAAAKHGMTSDGMRAYFETPENFSREDWGRMEALRQEMTESTSKPKATVRKNKRNKQQIKV